MSGILNMNKKKLVLGVGINDLPKGGTRSSKGGTKKFYKAWTNILRRCYCPKTQELQPTYKGVKVSEAWLTLSNFKKWYDTHFIIGQQIDKDILNRDSKIYSEDTCRFVPQYINTLLVERTKNADSPPRGVYFNASKGKFRAYMGKEGKSYHLGYYDCPQEASNAYVKAKEAYVKVVAKVAYIKGEICSEIYQSMLVWKVYP